MKIIDLGKMPWTDANGNTFPAHVFEIEGTDHKYIFDAECYNSCDASVWEPELKRWAEEVAATRAEMIHQALIEFRTHLATIPPSMGAYEVSQRVLKFCERHNITIEEFSNINPAANNPDSTDCMTPHASLE